MRDVVAASGRDVDRHVADDADAALVRVPAQRRPLALEAHLVGERVPSREADPVVDPEGVAALEVASLRTSDTRLGLGEQPGPSRERRRRGVRRAEVVRRVQRQHLPEACSRRREPVDERVRVRAEASPRQRRRMELHAEGPGQPHAGTVYRVGCNACRPHPGSGRPAAGRLRPLARESVPRRRRRDLRDGLPRRARRAPRDRPLPAARRAPLARDCRCSRSATTASPARSSRTRSGAGSSASRPGSTRTRRGSTSTTARSLPVRPSSRGELAEGEELFGPGTLDEWRAAAAALGARARARTRSTSPVLELDVERERARFGAWYELFPRSWGGLDGRRPSALPALAELGFDVVYLPPVHPIGVTNRKGRNNARALAARAIPAARGRSAAPRAGTTRSTRSSAREADFDALVRGRARARHGRRARLRDPVLARPPVAARAPGVVPAPPRRHAQVRREPAQALPGHLQRRLGHDDCARASGTRCATSCSHWCERGVRVFRVDNPHTKPVPFWEWLIDEVRARSPGRRSSSPRPSRGRR